MPPRGGTDGADSPPDQTFDLPQGAETTSVSKAAIPGGSALVGTSTEMIPFDGEGPQRRLRVKPYLIDTTAVTNARFSRFIDDTGYVTEAERIGWSFAFFAHLPEGVEAPERVPEAPWWRRVDGADWRLINGPGSEADWHPDHPVVQISWNDARAFAKWAGGRLPTEVEWEHAARGGLGDVRFPWGMAEPDDETHMPCNIWQGHFPRVNTGADGHIATAPVQSFAPNGYGLYNMCGNTWEWTADPFRIRSLHRQAKARQAAAKGHKICKGGSFLCHRSYCYRYRIAARTGTSPDSATTHQGLRLVYDP
ncbi:formylglycine-generating enzyme family protein [Rhodophyticola sp. CCM32]|uniref:formylglycine-generating enzyme family protein n=1 Tax=Rhodophyticola sp. CCM32 TaxID=2916397 RepID=UPI00107F213A|nr:formylglycine-generating enzyme family protein [Rhodophyticola sp. CCM32]QBX99386.1 formylglycine-generating enzyme family protein [Rhodophyticola sp. CCM32]